MVISNPLFEKILNSFESYTKSKKILAKFIVSHYRQVAFSTICQLSGISRVSEATIVRFTKDLGYKGYSDFQSDIRSIVRSELKANERFETSGAIVGRNFELLSGIINNEIENLRRLQETFEPENFREVLRAIQKASEIVVIGNRSTASIASQLSFGLSKLELRITRFTAVNTEMFDLLSKLPATAILIVISLPRYNRALFEAIEFAKELGLMTVSITDSPMSSIMGDLNLFTPDHTDSFITSHCSPMVMINALIQGLAQFDKQKTMQALTRFEKVAETQRYFI
jgi:DNA-binding MurR/RpiR family transcriptional regulator